MKKTNGIGLIETIISISILMIILLNVSQIICNSFKVLQTNQIRFKHLEKLHSSQVFLKGKSFTSSELAIGFHQKNDDEYKISWQIHLIDDQLKKIRLTVSNRFLCKSLIFYKSNLIQGGNQ
jgi:hypothetical protein